MKINLQKFYFDTISQIGHGILVDFSVISTKPEETP